MRLELVKVRIGPSHGNLKDVMQLPQRYRAWNHQPSPDCRANAGERDLDLVYAFAFCGCLGHTGILRALGDNRQVLKWHPSGTVITLLTVVS
jgi:hypothetical protein